MPLRCLATWHCQAYCWQPAELGRHCPSRTLLATNAGIVCVQRIQRDVNCLADPSKMTRKRALKKLREALVDDKHDPAALQGMFTFSLKPLLKQFPDPVRPRL